VSKNQTLIDHTPLTFGKHRGKTPEHVAEEDPSWLKWAFETIKDKGICSQALYRDCVKDVQASRKDNGEDGEDGEEERRASAAYGYMGQR
jgi:hypothetical protein